MYPARLPHHNKLIFRETFFPPIKKNRVYFFSFMDTRTSRALSFEGGSRGGVVKSRFHCPRFQFQRGGLFAGQYTLKKRVA